MFAQLGKVNCRTGSLEKHKAYGKIYTPVNCRTGSLEISRWRYGCHIIETGNESFRFKQSSATAKERIKSRESSLRTSLISENIENNIYE